MAPYISLGVMCHDAHLASLERCLRSVLVRTSGEPLVDEVVIGFNGADYQQLRTRLESLGYRELNGGQVQDDGGHPGYLFEFAGEKVDIHLPLLRVRTFKWPGRFDTARNIWWKLLKGEWLLWLDADDIVADTGVPEQLKWVEACEKDYGLPPITPAELPPVRGSGTLKSFLANLPSTTNLVFCPYDYELDPNGYVLTRQKMRRIVRRSAEHVWASPEASGIHEALLPLGPIPEEAAETFGVLVRQLEVQSVHERVVRNREVVAAQSGTTVDLAKADIKDLMDPTKVADARHAFDVANAALSVGNYALADQSIQLAIRFAPNDMEKYTYLLARAALWTTRGHYAGVLSEAFMALGILPDLRDAYFLIAEAYFHLGRWESVLEWYRLGQQRKPTLLSRDQPLAMHQAPRGQAAMALVNLRRPEEALSIVAEMRDRYPEHALTKEVAAKVELAVRTMRGHKASVDLLEYLTDVAPEAAVDVLYSLQQTPLLKAVRPRWETFAEKLRSRPVALNVVGVEDAEAALLSDAPSTVQVSLESGGVLTPDHIEHAFAHQELQPLEYEQLTERTANVTFRRRAGRVAGEEVHFYCPIGVESWSPLDLEVKGMGGSESSVAYLAQELAAQGHRVTVFSPKTDEELALWRGVSVRRLYDWTPDEHAVTVLCRSPWLVRTDERVRKLVLEGKVWCWHQDNGYGNRWMWDEEVVGMLRHFYVSEWARGSLLKDAGLDEKLSPKRRDHVVLGNGVSVDFLLEPKRRVKNPYKVVYASDPTRGLEKLLDAWPAVVAKMPQAELTVMCGFRVMLAMKQGAPGMSALDRLKKIRQRLEGGVPRVRFAEWVTHKQVAAEYADANLYVYPGGPMPEGYGVALVQAQLAGCEVLCPNAGALPEVLGDHGCFLFSESTPASLVSEAIIDSMVNPMLNDARQAAIDWTWKHHSWEKVAERFLGALK